MGEMIRWRTSDELTFLYTLAAQKKAKALQGYLRAATMHHRDWGGMDSQRIIAYARQALLSVLTGTAVVPPMRLEQ